MLFIRQLFHLLLFRLVSARPQINLHFTDRISEHGIDATVQYDCFEVDVLMTKNTDPYQLMSYCRSELSSKEDVEPNGIHPNFTFEQLFQQNLTSKQLYRWSAPIDVIERYQLYLDQRSTVNVSTSSSIGKELFYNCTLSRFGRSCEYSLVSNYSSYSTLNEIIHHYYINNKYEPTTLTCYMYLVCDLGSDLLCLDWSDICDGVVQCRNGVDEEHCWQMEVNQCRDDEYRCRNGQCVPKRYAAEEYGYFLESRLDSFECLDRTDEFPLLKGIPVDGGNEPTFLSEDIICLYWKYLDLRLTSSCVEKRITLLIKTMLSEKPHFINQTCWSAVKCLLLHNSYESMCDEFNTPSIAKKLINQTCPDMFFYPAVPIAYGHIYFLYKRQDIIDRIHSFEPSYICYNDQLCSGFFPRKTLIMFNNSTCRRPEDFVHLPFGYTSQIAWRYYVMTIYHFLSQCNTILVNQSIPCNKLDLYRCQKSSKCISKYRLCDAVVDCPYEDDEKCSLDDEICSVHGHDILLKCRLTNECISPKLINNGNCDCTADDNGFCEDEIVSSTYIKTHISFPIICDGFTELATVSIDEHEETDETECNYWQCNNTYTRCNGVWNCLNGADEIDCDPSPLLKCPPYHHICVSLKEVQLMCLPLENAGDGKIDCFGSTDELHSCRKRTSRYDEIFMHCKDKICVDKDEQCRSNAPCVEEKYLKLCNANIPNSLEEVNADDYDPLYLDIIKYSIYFYHHRFRVSKSAIVHFSLDTKVNSIQKSSKALTTHFITSEETPNQLGQQCHRGFPLHVWLNNETNFPSIACLCPPSFYGNQCQYQNQRVSLTLRFRTFSDSRQKLFALVILLIEDTTERIIHSHQQFTYISTRDCQRKFNIYLLYSTRPKNLNNKYLIHVDIYEKISLAYRGSLLIPLNYSFLPVHRVAVDWKMPTMKDEIKTCSDRQCIYGRCIKYLNDSKDNSFCQCQPGWSGEDCSIPYACMCSSHLSCVGILPNNRSICLCSANQFGSQCRFRNTICESNSSALCSYHGHCIPMIENKITETFICICLKGYTGKKCEIRDTELILSFHQDISLYKSILVHFIQIIPDAAPENGSTYQIIPMNQNSISIYWSFPFHIAFVEVSHSQYYLIIVQKQYNQSSILRKTIYSSDRCPYLGEILNETIVHFHLIRRIKYYHLACQKSSPSTPCFFDDNHFCLCNDYGGQRVANCFEFNYRRKFDCFGSSSCENGAQCLQDSSICPQTSICICPRCYYGRQCQFNTYIYGLSLDAILGYHIQPHVNINQQSLIVQVSMALTIVMMIVGLINGILSLITFKKKNSQRTGCGLYLLCSSITTLFTITMFGIKYWILLMAHMGSITNRSFLYVQCVSIDFLIQIGLNIDQWLNACVAMERALTTWKGIFIDMKKSKQMAKYIILILILLIICTSIQDPLYRHLIEEKTDDNDENRIWCIVKYPYTALQMFNSMTYLLHFFIPFAINVISALIIIVITARQRTNAQSKQTPRETLHEQFKQHKHLLISSIILVILGLPRAIISLVSGCMETTNNVWLFLLGYYISFIPLILTFVIFVLPSKLYTEEFFDTIKQYQQNTKRFLYRT